MAIQQRDPRGGGGSRDARTNRRIKAREVRLVGPEGEQLVVLPVEQALARAQELGMDLVEVSPMAKPPVCKIMDYGKFKYLEKKKQNEAKKKQVVVQLKEVKLRPRTEEHDYDVKIKKVREFLAESNKARITVMFRGREMSHRELGQKVLQRIIEDLRDTAVIEAAPRMEGRQMFMILAPNPKMLQSIRDRAKAAAAAAPAAAAAASASASPTSASPASESPAAAPAPAPSATPAPAPSTPAPAAAAPEPGAPR
jgi:translation initiation factor IF-3